MTSCFASPHSEKGASDERPASQVYTHFSSTRGGRLKAEEKAQDEMEDTVAKANGEHEEKAQDEEEKLTHEAEKEAEKVENDAKQEEGRLLPCLSFMLCNELLLHTHTCSTE